MKQVAEMVGVSEATVSRWESGDIVSMSADRFNAFCRALHIKADDVLFDMGNDMVLEYPDRKDVHGVSENERELLKITYNMNEDGLKRLLMYAEDIRDKYLKGDGNAKKEV